MFLIRPSAVNAASPVCSSDCAELPHDLGGGEQPEAGTEPDPGDPERPDTDRLPRPQLEQLLLDGKEALRLGHLGSPLADHRGPTGPGKLPLELLAGAGGPRVSTLQGAAVADQLDDELPGRRHLAARPVDGVEHAVQPSICTGVISPMSPGATLK